LQKPLKQNKNKSHKEFEKLLSEDLENRKFKEGEITTGTVEEVGKKFIFVDLGLKSSGAIPIEEFELTKEIDKIEIGSKVEVLLEKIENRDGEVVVSREKARKAKSWKKMEKAFENKQEVTGIIISRCKGGFAVNVDSCLCFLPGSQVDLRPLKNFDHLMKVPQTFECVKLDKKRGNQLVVVAGKEYGAGSSRDWAAKGTKLLGIKAVIAESFERIHRSNLVGMGVLPLQFKEGFDRKKLNIKGSELFTIIDIEKGVEPRKEVDCEIKYADGSNKKIKLLCRIDTANEIEYYKNGGILQYVLRNMLYNRKKN